MNLKLFSTSQNIGLIKEKRSETTDIGGEFDLENKINIFK
jgi:hypothetical protein